LSEFKVRVYYTCKVQSCLISVHDSTVKVCKMKPYFFFTLSFLFSCMFLYSLLYLSHRKLTSLQDTQGCAINTIKLSSNKPVAGNLFLW